MNNNNNNNNNYKNNNGGPLSRLVIQGLSKSIRPFYFLFYFVFPSRSIR